MGAQAMCNGELGRLNPSARPTRRRDNLRNISQITRPGRHPAPLHRAGAGRRVYPKSPVAKALTGAGTTRGDEP